MKVENMHESHNHHIDHLFEQNQRTDVVVRLNAGEDPASVVKEKYSPEKKYEPTRIVCCDGRPVHDGKDFCIAGSGKLLSAEDFKKMLEQNPSITTITWHDECGALNIAFENDKANGALPEGIETSAQYAQYWTEKVARENGLECEHISKDQFVAPYHFEQGIVIDKTGKFHPSMLKDMPNMFVSHSASFAGGTYPATEAKILTGIALGEHGLGNRIKQEAPFYIMAICDNEDQAASLQAEIENSVREYGDKVKVRAFTAPSN